jgi:glycosyltransferase involved in cell wall biosynthesis
MTTDILYLASTLARAGPTQQLLNIVSRLDRRDWRPFVLTLSPEPAQSLWADFAKAGVELKSLGFGRKETLTRALPALRSEIERLAPGLVHSHGARADMLAARLSGAPKIATVRNIPWLDYPMTYGLAGYGLAGLHLTMLRRLTQVVAVSETVRASLAPMLPHLQTIRNGVDLDRFRPTAQSEKRALRQTHGVPSDAVVVVATGHLSARKNPELLAEAARAAGVVLLLVGDGPEAPVLERISAGHPDIRLVGRQADVGPYLAMADLFASASHAEGFPNAVLEALASGLPCVLSDIGPHGELATIGGDTLHYFPASGANALPTLAGLLSQARIWATPQAGKRSRAFAERRLDARSMVQSYEALYARLVHNPSGRTATLEEPPR